MRSLADINWQGKVALLRADFNVPLANGKVADDSRLRAAIPGILHIIQNGGGVVCLSHLGRPQEGVFDSALSLALVAEHLSSLLTMPVHFHAQPPQCKPEAGEVWMLENTRFNVGEKSNASSTAAVYAAMGDVFVLDAFATAHRKEASLCALAAAADDACAGMLLQKELGALARVMDKPACPAVAVVGGGKVSSKLPVLEQLLELCDYLIVGGGIANTFLAAQGFYIAESLVEHSMLAHARKMLKEHGEKIVLPADVIIANEVSDKVAADKLSVEELSGIKSDMRILDVGDISAAANEKLLQSAGTIIWNGPLGVFELAPFAEGTRKLAEAIAASPAYSLAGGGDTLAAAVKFNVSERISYLSTGGGAFLELLAGAKLPALEALKERVGG